MKLGHVALDGTKIKANASKHKAMSYERMKKREAELAGRGRSLAGRPPRRPMRRRTSSTADKRGDEMPDWVADKQKRLAKIREAKAALEAEAKAAAEEETRRRGRSGGAAQGRRPQEDRQDAGAAEREPDAKAQRNFTDPESRILKTKDGFIQGYNAQAAVDGEAQIIVAHGLTHEHERSGPAGAAHRRHRGQSRPQAEGGLGRCRLLQRGQSRSARRDAASTAMSPPDAPSTRPTPSAKIGRTADPGHATTSSSGRDGEAATACRKQIVEPVFGQIKQARGFRQFLLRGIEKVRPNGR